MKRLIPTLALLVLSANSAHADWNRSYTGSGLWRSSSPQGNCFGANYKEAVLKDAYSQCRSSYSDSTCRHAMDAARGADIFSTQTPNGWSQVQGPMGPVRDTYECNLSVEIFLEL
ncbi:MAG: hypothetical protein ACXWR1_08215 [Bdellovibrionota bacterium]